MVSNFDRSKLSPEGYIVLVDDRDVTLPSESRFSLLSSASVLATLLETASLTGGIGALTDGDIVADGTDFRNSAHLRYKADILVPCGGRPESINIGNVSRLWDADGVPNFKYLVCVLFLSFSLLRRFADADSRRRPPPLSLLLLSSRPLLLLLLDFLHLQRGRQPLLLAGRSPSAREEGRRRHPRRVGQQGCVARTSLEFLVDSLSQLTSSLPHASCRWCHVV